MRIPISKEWRRIEGEQQQRGKGSNRDSNETRGEDRRAKKFLRLINRAGRNVVVGMGEGSERSGIRDKEKNF